MENENASSSLLQNHPRSGFNDKGRVDTNSGIKDANKRNLLGFWLLGLCNNFAYVVMLSAAHDILNKGRIANKQQNGTESILYSLSSNSSKGNATDVKHDSIGCNPLSTGTILLADILPTLFIKITAPLYMNRINYHIRVAVCILFAFASFFLVACSEVLWLSLLGVICASISSGFGEITLLSFSAHFDKNVVSTWSSGTGAAGLFGALSYAGFISAGVTPKVTVLLMNIVPFLMGVSFWYILEYPTHLKSGWKSFYSPDYLPEHTAIMNENNKDSHNQTAENLTLLEKLAVVKSLLIYMVPLMLVYFAEYFINQGLHELIFFEGIWITPAEQYRWYQVDYQLAVLVSRSSVNIAPIRNICLLAILQYVNLVVLLFEALFHFIPSIWIVLAIIMFEGLLGGAVYVNAFYRITKEVLPSHREFCMGVASMADSFGISLAGLVALPTHNGLCSFWLSKSTM